MLPLESIITAIQLLALGALCIASPVIAFLKLKWRLAAVERELDDQCQHLQMLEQELAVYRQAVLTAQQGQHEKGVLNVDVPATTSRLVALPKPTGPLVEPNLGSRSLPSSSSQLPNPGDRAL